MQQWLFPAVCLVIALLCAVFAIYLRATSAGFERAARVCVATVTGFTVEAAEHARPLVRFVPEGETEALTLPAQSAGTAADKASEGDRVQIMYTKKKVFGKDLWNIFIVSDGIRARPYRAYDIISGVLAAVAAILLLAAFKFLRR